MVDTLSKAATKRPSTKKWLWAFWKQRYLTLLVLPGLLTLVIFKYIPMLGIQIAFKDYKFKQGIWGSAWAGLKHFDQMLRDVTIVPAIINTLGISILKLVICFPIPIVFALLLNEMRSRRIKRVVQTVSYFPHFISYSIVALQLTILLARTGPVNGILRALGIVEGGYLFLGEKDAFWWIVVGTDVWKTTGWNSIIYFSALTAISPDLYEAATVDGANRWQKMRSITLPCLKTTILMLLILRVGSIVNGANFDLSYLLSNSLNATRAEILPTYVLRVGIQEGRFAYATAVGLMQAATSLLLVLGANWATNILSGEGLF